MRQGFFGRLLLLGTLFLPFLLSSAGGEATGKDAVASPQAEDTPHKRRLAAIDKILDGETEKLLAIYKHIHANPELAFQEEQTAKLLAKEMKALGFDVTTGVGGTGVVAIFKNGPGPVVLVRTDMDALPVTENTGVPYASKIRLRDKEGRDIGAMHACGHDMHMTIWLGTARTLVRLKDQWHGTLIMIGQPAEEVGGGARRMLADGLFKRFPRPDYCLALHCDSLSQVGHISYAEGLMMANVDMIDVTVYGRGGHGAAPHTTIDPIVLSARIILDLQTLVSRETNPTDAVVVTVGSIHGGTKHNIIPSEVKMQLTVRTLKDDVRKHILEGIQRICKAAAQGAKAPEPLVRVELDSFTPAVFNNAALAKKTVGVFTEVFGAERVHQRGPIMGGEDFGRFGKEGVPIFMYFLGTIDATRYEASKKPGGKELPSMHSEFYYPTPEPSLRAGVQSMSLAVLNLMGK